MPLHNSMASETIAVAHLTGSIFLSFKTDHTMCDQKQKDATSSISIARNHRGSSWKGTWRSLSPTPCSVEAPEPERWRSKPQPIS